MDETLSKTQKWLVALFLAIIMSAGTARLVMSSKWYAKRSAGVLSVEREQPVALITVDVDGAVNKPGVHRLPQGSTLGAAVEMAGGRTRAADTRCINFTDIIEDRQKIYIPYKSEHLCPTPQAPNAAAPSIATMPAGEHEGPPGVVNINTANVQALETLPGIGPTYAQRIVELRMARGSFRTIEEIMLVKGIGDTKFEQIKHLIKVTD